MNAPTPRGCINKGQIAGIASSVETAVLFYVWACEKGERLCAKDIQARFECSRATAYRWMAVFRDLDGRIGPVRRA